MFLANLYTLNSSPMVPNAAHSNNFYGVGKGPSKVLVKPQKISAKRSSQERHTHPVTVSASQPHKPGRVTWLSNPIDPFRLKKLLAQVKPNPNTFHPLNTLHPTNTQSLSQATKQLLQLGHSFLALQEELSQELVDKNRFTYQPSHLVIYRDETTQSKGEQVILRPPKIVRYVETPNNNRRWLQRPWRYMANLTQQLAKEEPATSYRVPLQATHVLAQIFAYGFNPDLFDLQRNLKKCQTRLQNTFKGVGPISWTDAERQALDPIASRYGFNVAYDDELTDYTEALFTMLERIAAQLENADMAHGRQASQLGIAYRLPNGRQAFLDLSEQFPGGNLTASRPVTHPDRVRLEQLFQQNDAL